MLPNLSFFLSGIECLSYLQPETTLPLGLAGGHKFVELDNQLRAVLISDPSAGHAAVALRVGTGAYGDPVDFPGLALVTNHILLLGSKRYPNVYRSFIEANEGSDAVQTGSTQSVFSFEVGHWALESALDIFSRLFIEPTFSKEEMNQEVVRMIEERNSPLRMFSIATKAKLKAADTLAFKRVSDIHATLTSHFERYFSSSQMVLVVLGRENITSLQNIVTSKFSPIQNKIPSPELLPNADMFASDVLIDPYAKVNQLVIRFLLPSSIHNHFDFLAWLVNSSSLHQTLKLKGYSSIPLSVAIEKGTSISAFSIGMTVTDKGQAHKHHILRLVLIFLKTIRIRDIPQDYHHFIHSTRHRLSSTNNPLRLVQDLAQQLHFSPIPNQPSFNPRHFLAALEHFKPTNLTLFSDHKLTSDYSIDPDSCAKYHMAKFPPDVIARLHAVTSDDFDTNIHPQ
ncbi:hypothetical protein DSO57_1033232 [Entomophthora muscae]|uniref:Uncharacterized protein n=1 Tax=Entomophthora muscae TaxID=34485 RepID=A0ACC2UKU8_9FUNG|nr:hypothetical protein DSO57_1033232 [Entomophthora muscae]